MTDELRSCWRNCALEADAEILEIDRLEDELGPIAPGVSKVRELISTLELCHHKAERWVTNIIEAIGLGETNKGLGTRPLGHRHAAEDVWQQACATLMAWCAGCPAGSADLSVGSLPASHLLASLGERSPLKEWQVQRVIEKIRSTVHWPQPCEDLTAQYVWILFSGGEEASMYRSQCPERFKEHEDLWRATVRTIIHDTENGDPASLSLGLAIDMLWPCHWMFVDNLQTVLAAIGGRLTADCPFAACGRNITLLPFRDRMTTVSKAVRVFCGYSKEVAGLDENAIALLGQPTKIKKWLAASLDKTIRLQMDPPAAMRAASALAGPAWIQQ